MTTDHVGVCVAGEEPKHRAEVEALLAGLWDLLGTPAVPIDGIDFDANQLGDGYGVPSDATLEAIELCATTEGLLLDPVYTGKAMAALVEAVRSGRVGEQPILFWHTGGSSGLFAYRDALVQEPLEGR